MNDMLVITCSNKEKVGINVKELLTFVHKHGVLYLEFKNAKVREIVGGNANEVGEALCDHFTQAPEFLKKKKETQALADYFDSLDS